MMRIIYPLTVLLLAPAIVLAQDTEPPMEAMVLADGDSGSEWNVAEATMEPDATHSREGGAMRFHIDVNHETGQPEYPIGWPRTYTAVPEDHRDWREWDFIDFWLYAETSRESLPDTPLGFIVRSPDRPNSFNATLDEAKKGEWVHFRFPTSDMPNPAECTRVQYFIAEANYNHGDVLDFWIDDLALLRYAQPTLISLQPVANLEYADTDVVRIEVDLTGVDEGETVEVLARLVRDGSTVRQSSATLANGRQTIPLTVGGGLPAGTYTVQAQIVGNDRTLSEDVRVISSPWEGDAQ